MISIMNCYIRFTLLTHSAMLPVVNLVRKRRESCPTHHLRVRDTLSRIEKIFFIKIDCWHRYLENKINFVYRNRKEDDFLLMHKPVWRVFWNTLTYTLLRNCIARISLLLNIEWFSFCNSRCLFNWLAPPWKMPHVPLKTACWNQNDPYGCSALECVCRCQGCA